MAVPSGSDRVVRVSILEGSGEGGKGRLVPV